MICEMTTFAVRARLGDFCLVAEIARSTTGVVASQTRSAPSLGSRWQR
jgi:hypothetical protein